MHERYVGRSGLRASRLGLGTMTWGRDTDEHEAAEQLREFLGAGGTLLDTGTGYGGGAPEEVLGKLLAGGVVAREELVLCAKAVPARSGRLLPPPSGGDVHGWPVVDPCPDTSRRAMLAALDASLGRLGTDYLDLWLAPGWNGRIPLEETLSALETAVGSGRVRYAGVSNLTGWQTALAASTATPPGVPIATQVEYSLLERGIEREVLPAAHALGLGVIAWSPLGRGVLTGKYRSGTPSDSRAASAHLADFVAPYLAAPARRVVDAVVTAADGLGCSPLEVALAWVRDRPGLSCVLVGARTAAQLRASLAAEDVELPREIRAALDEVSAPTSGYPEA